MSGLRPVLVVVVEADDDLDGGSVVSQAVSRATRMKKVTPVKKRPAGAPAPTLAQGWPVQTKTRAGGKTEGMVGKYWVSPDDMKFRSLKAAEAYFGQKF